MRLIAAQARLTISCDEDDGLKQNRCVTDARKVAETPEEYGAQLYPGGKGKLILTTGNYHGTVCSEKVSD